MPEYKEKIVIDSWFWRSRKKDFRYRYDPVPGISNGRCCYSSSYRWPKTFQELRSGYIVDEDDSLSASQIERVTKVRDLPTIRDDVLRSDWRNKSWKRHRKTQHLSSERTFSLQ